MLSRCFLDFSVGVRASVIGLSQISSFSLSIGAIHGYMKSWEIWFIYTIHIMQSHNEYHLQMLPYVYTISLQVAGRKSQNSQENILPDLFTAMAFLFSRCL